MTTASQKELVSIGLPVYNGIPFVKKAIESVLSQTYSNIELIISDNPSTDGTQALCEEYAHKDKRVRYVRHKENIGLHANYKFPFDNSRGEYFCWVSYDDFLDIHFVEKCLALLRDDKEAVMAMSDFVFVNDRGEITHKVDPKDYFTTERDLYLRLKRFILMDWGGGKATAFHGLWRRAALAHDTCRELPDGDINFVLRALSRGPFLLVNEVLFFKGVMPGGESREHEELTFRRIVSAILFRIKLVPAYLFAMKCVAGFHRLSYAERFKLIFWNCLAAAKMFVRRKY